MNLWPFSKKNQNTLISHDEFPPGVMLATDDEATPAPVEYSAESSQTFEIQPGPQESEPPINGGAIGQIAAPSPTSTPSRSPQDQYLDLFTPPATPDILWQQQATAPTPALELALPAQEVSEISEVIVDFEPSEPSTLHDSSQALEWLPEAEVEAPQAVFEPEQPLEEVSFEVSDTDAFEPLNNVVPFPVRSQEAAAEAAIEWIPGSSDVTAFETDLADTTGPDCAFLPESLEADALEMPLSLDTQAISFEEIPVPASDTSFWVESDEAASAETSFSLESPEQDSWASHELDPVAELPVDWPIEGELEPSVTDSLSTYQPEEDAKTDFKSLSEASFDEPSMQWDAVEEITETSSVKNWDTYDLGHYDDPDEPVAPLELDNEEPEHLDLAFELAVEACSLPEPELQPAPMPEPAMEIPDLSSVQPVAPVQGEIVTNWTKNTAPRISASKAIHNFSQQVILEESQSIKRSIDDLVERYFAQKEAGL